MCREGEGKVSPGVISQMNPGPYIWPLYLRGLPFPGGFNEPPPAKGEFARLAQMLPASLGRGPVTADKSQSSILKLFYLLD